MAESLGDAVLDLRTDSRRFDRGIDSAKRRGQRLARDFKAVGASIARSFGIAATAAAGLGVVTVKMATDLNRSMANVATLIPGNTARVNELKAAVQGLAVAQGKDTADLAKGLYQTISAFGDEAGKTVKILEINAKAAAAGLAETTEAVDLTSAITKAYGDTTAEAVKKVADLALTTVKLGQTDFPQLAASMGKVTPIAQAMGQSQEELFAVFATATGVVGKASEVSTQYRGVLASLLNPTEAMTALIEKSGFASGKAMLEQRGLVGTLQDIVRAAEQAGVPITEYVSAIESVPLALALAGPQADTFTAKLAELGNAAGATDIAFREQTEGVNAFGFQLATLKQEIVVTAQQIGDRLIPIAGELVAIIRGYIKNEGPEIVELVGVLLVQALQGATSVLGIFAKGVTLVKEATNLAGAAVSAFNVGLLKLRRAGLQKSLDLGVTEVQEFGMSAAETTAMIAELDAQIAGAEGTLDGFVDGYVAAQDESSKFQAVIDKMQGTLKDWAKRVREGTAATAGLANGMDVAALAAANMEFAVDGVARALEVVRQKLIDAEMATVNMEFAVDGVARAAQDARMEFANMEFAVDGVAEASENATKATGNFFANLKTGIPIIDSLIGALRGLVNRGLSFLGDALGKLFGGGKIGSLIGNMLTGILGGLFGGKGGGISGILGGLFGASGGGAGISGILGGLFGGGGAVAGVSGPIAGFTVGGGAAGAGFLSGLTGAISGGAAAIGGALSSLAATVAPLFTNPFTAIVGGAILGVFALKKLFGGPSKVELAGRKVAKTFSETLASMLTDQQRLEFGAEKWKLSVIALRDTFLALGKTEAEALAISDALWRAEKKGPEAVQAVIAGIQPSLDAVQAAMASTGLSLTELRDLAFNKSVELGISIADAFQAIADGTIDTMKKATAATAKATEDMASQVGKAVPGVIADHQRSADEVRDAWIARMSEIKDEMDSTARSGIRSFEVMRDDFGGFLSDMEDRAGLFRTRLVGASIFPDTVKKSVAWFVQLGFGIQDAMHFAEKAVEASTAKMDAHLAAVGSQRFGPLDLAFFATQGPQDRAFAASQGVRADGNQAKVLEELRGLRRDLNTILPTTMERVARHGAQTAGRRRN